MLGAPLKSSDLCLPPHMNPNSYQSCSFRIPKARGPACIGLKRLRVSAKVSHGPLSELSTGDLQRSGPRKRGLSLHPGPTAPGRDRRPFPGMGAFRPHGAPLLEAAFLGGQRGLDAGVTAALRLAKENKDPPLLPTPAGAPRGLTGPR